MITLFLATSISIVVITLLHERLHHQARLLETSVLALECVVMALVATLTFQEGARWLPYLYVIACVGFAIAFAVRMVKRPAQVSAT